MQIPFIDLKAQYNQIKDEIIEALKSVMEKTAFAGGAFVEKFEQEFADFFGCKEAVGVGSGTEALWLALKGLGIKQGDEVITAVNTFIATAEAISLCGAKPVFVDIDENSFNMEPCGIENAITSKTKAIIPVHLYGQPADLDSILDIAKAHKLFVIEDACQAHGAEYKGRKAGTFGDAGCFSFYPGKNLGAYGEAGAVITNRPELAEQIRKLRDHGQEKKYYHSMIGVNSRMDGFQAAVLTVKLKYLDDWNQARRKHAMRYNELLDGVYSLTVPTELDHVKHVYHIYSIRTANRDQLKESLAKSEISCGIHYPVPLHLQGAYQFLEYEKGSFPIAERVAREILSLPMFPELTKEQAEKVVKEIRRFKHQ